jgi:hypothetical protein
MYLTVQCDTTTGRFNIPMPASATVNQVKATSQDRENKKNVAGQNAFEGAAACFIVQGQIFN